MPGRITVAAVCHMAVSTTAPESATMGEIPSGCFKASCDKIVGKGRNIVRDESDRQKDSCSKKRDKDTHRARATDRLRHNRANQKQRETDRQTYIRQRDTDRHINRPTYVQIGMSRDR